MNNLRRYIECSCTDARHVLRLTFYDDEKTISIENQLVKSPFFTRLKLAFSYLFNLDMPIDSLWSETLLNETQTLELFESLLAFNIRVGAKSTSANKLKQALKDIQSGKTNTAYNSKPDRKVI